MNGELRALALALVLLLTAGVVLAQTSSSGSRLPAADAIVATPPPPPPPRKRTPPPRSPTAEPRDPVDAPREPAGGRQTGASASSATFSPSSLPDPRGDDGATAPTTPGTPAQPPGAVSIAEPPATSTAARLARELLVVSTDVAEADTQRSWLTSRGAQLLRRRTLANLGWVLSVYRLKPAIATPELAAEFATQWPAAAPEINQRYAQLAESADGAALEWARPSIGWPERCAAAPRIAMLDGPVNLALPLLRGRRVQTVAIAAADAEPDYRHGTLLAALLLGDATPRGLLPEAELLVGVIMNRDDDGPYTTTELVLRGLDWVLGLEPAASALNLSFGGPRSAQIERALERVARRLPVAAAAGNSGGRSVAYPAAYASVIAVTAVDAKGRRWARANTGEQVAVAAPGVEVWTRGAAGEGHYANGTSVATLFVTAALAVTERAPAPQWLAAHTREAGAPGRDSEYGHGLLSVSGACPQVRK